nr:hypothetical protein [Flavobacterium sp.]
MILTDAAEPETIAIDFFLAVAKTPFPVKAKLWVRPRMPNPETSGKENT